MNPLGMIAQYGQNVMDTRQQREVDPTNVTGTLKQAGEDFVGGNIGTMKQVGQGIGNWIQRGAQSIGKHGRNIGQLMGLQATPPAQYNPQQMAEMMRMRNMDQGNLANRAARDAAYNHFVMNKPALPQIQQPLE